MDIPRTRSWRHEGGSGKFRHSSLHHNRSGMSDPLLDPENPRHVRFAEGTVSGSHIDLDAANDDRPDESPWGGEYIKSMVYGGLDAIVTTFALVASVSGGQYSSGAVLVLGCANLIADGISMGFGDYLSSTTEKSYAATQKEISDWEFRRNMEQQVMNLVNIYVEHGMERSDAEQVVTIFTKYGNVFTKAKMTMDDGLLPPDEEESAVKNGLVTFFSFLAFGCTPLLSFAVLNPITDSIYVKFGVACLVTALTLVLLGVCKAKISGEKYLNSVFTVLGNGGLAALAAYFISYYLEKLSGTD